MCESIKISSGGRFDVPTGACRGGADEFAGIRKDLLASVDEISELPSLLEDFPHSKLPEQSEPSFLLRGLQQALHLKQVRLIHSLLDRYSSAARFFQSIGLVRKTVSSRPLDSQLDLDSFDSDDSEFDTISETDIQANWSRRASKDSPTCQAYRSARSIAYARANNLQIVSPRPIKDSLTPSDSPVALPKRNDSTIDVSQNIELDSPHQPCVLSDICAAVAC
ncbi:hypothetical protein HBH98_079900 [Parastagonospora nodorum]|nr:hypothetical protein HBI09_089540 [Parastagonospora nodorum]KAH4052969.1 hypothetical protein HBH49_093230 [Parastagonospora nodorum]KAH4068682.1 hypothetical protein HBH50_117180 [Parastagonospora nodorum]KAH4100273.1 hypothetical protein HBH48_018720 [Parastagonospora nodorum]KAH4348355.1 hypothetical protein HBH98_079900 [Parastagonospora nodorum]